MSFWIVPLLTCIRGVIVKWVLENDVMEFISISHPSSTVSRGYHIYRKYEVFC